MADHDIAESFKATIGPSLQSSYAEVHVLLLAWADHDLGDIDSEIRDLRSVFEQDYNYSSVSFFQIPSNGSQRARLNTEISTFVEQKSSRHDSLIIVYYAGHCSADAQGQAEWAALEKGGPTLSWYVTQQLLFSASGDVLLILDCCNASLIARGFNDGDGRFELIAASAKGVKTPEPGRRSFTRALIRLPKQHCDEGISTESLASKLREDSRITGKETPVFHDFVRKSPTKITLQRLQSPDISKRFIQKPSGYLLFRASLTDDVTGLQIAKWLKAAPPRGVTAVNIEAVVSRSRHTQEASNEGLFPAGSVFEQLSKSAREEIIRGVRGLNTVMAVTAEDARRHVAANEATTIDKPLGEVQDAMSAMSTAAEAPLLLSTSSGRGPLSIQDAPGDGLMATTDLLREALLLEDSHHYSSEISRNKIHFNLFKRGGVKDKSQRRLKLGTMDGKPIIVETYSNEEGSFSQKLQHVQRLTSLLCHPKQIHFPILPCAGFFRDQFRQELGLVFRAPPTFPARSNNGPKVGTLLQLYRMHRVVPLDLRIHLAWALATAVGRFHCVGWVHKSIRSNNIAFTAMSKTSPTEQSGAECLDGADQDSSFIGGFDLSKPLVFGFDHFDRSDISDEATCMDEDTSLINNLYRHPETCDRSTARFKRSHDVYSLGVVLLEIALWKEAGSILKSFLETKPFVSSDAPRFLIGKCGKPLSHQVGRVFAQCIVTCLEFGARTEDMNEYDAQRRPPQPWMLRPKSATTKANTAILDKDANQWTLLPHRGPLLM
ncbi:HET-s domain [Fusarium albosuccineum]|uniref:HET-s domain n=1 Tax=Fusarium albosuccineum TaxID=1237068 RepID=A0A8H4LLR9_9HYPO|nr:HET-s domain [Fusarium albosuccineum]